MKVISIQDMYATERQVDSPLGEFTSLRFLLAEDVTGFTMTHTTVRPCGWLHWYYKYHYEACYCIKGLGYVKNIRSGEVYTIKPGVFYAVRNEEHCFKAVVETELICVFNPPLRGKEIHNEDGIYEV